MSLIISPNGQRKLATKHNVTKDEIEQCFMNHDGRYLRDEREEHATSPPRPCGSLERPTLAVN